MVRVFLSVSLSISLSLSLSPLLPIDMPQVVSDCGVRHACALKTISLSSLILCLLNCLTHREVWDKYSPCCLMWRLGKDLAKK
jgi:uncharacterized membrane protein